MLFVELEGCSGAWGLWRKLCCTPSCEYNRHALACTLNFYLNPFCHNYFCLCLHILYTIYIYLLCFFRHFSIKQLSLAAIRNIVVDGLCRTMGVFHTKLPTSRWTCATVSSISSFSFKWKTFSIMHTAVAALAIVVVVVSLCFFIVPLVDCQAIISRASTMARDGSGQFWANHNCDWTCLQWAGALWRGSIKETVNILKYLKTFCLFNIFLFLLIYYKEYFQV